jgi:diguanylate cyclase (GGDEF)-like protein
MTRVRAAWAISARDADSRGSAWLAAYAACFAATWGLIGLESRLELAELAVALALQAWVGVSLIETSRPARDRSAAALGIVGFLASVALLRDGVGRTPGYGALLLLPIIWAALRGRRAELAWAIAGAAAVLLAPIVLIGGQRYPQSGWRTGALFVVIAAIIGATVLALIERLSESEERVERQRDEARTMLATQDSLRLIATLIAENAAPAAVFNVVAQEVAGLFGGTLGGVVRFDGGRCIGELAGGWSSDGTDVVGQTIDLTGTTAAALVYQTGAPAQVAGYPPRFAEPIIEQFKLGMAICAPIRVGGMLWGSIGTSFADGATIPTDGDERLAQFADLVAVAIANAEARETLAHQAATDPVTGLANHRTFHERLRTEIERASRHGRRLSLAVLDIDHFKGINDTHGHQTGDDVLAAIAERLAAQARTGEIIARTGGEEFAWLMPETDADGAYLAAERARRAIEGTPFEMAGIVTISAGVCSDEHADTAPELFGAADEALYRAKRTGRNRTVIYEAGRALQAREQTIP